MTQPKLVGFLYDQPGQEPKVFFRAMLYSTGKRGHIVEALYLKVRRGESTQTFNFLDVRRDQRPENRSGLAVREEGVACNHHFLPPRDAASFQFLAGEYHIETYAKIVNQNATVRLSAITLSVPESLAAAMRDPTKGVFFTWGPESQSYRGDISQGPVPYYLRGRRQTNNQPGDIE